MEDNNQHIEHLFRNTFQNYKVESGQDGWDEIDLQLEKKKFFRFNIDRFNIYYAAAIMASCLFSSAVAVDYFFLSRPKNSFPQEVFVEKQKSNIEISGAQASEKPDPETKKIEKKPEAKQNLSANRNYTAPSLSNTAGQQSTKEKISGNSLSSKAQTKDIAAGSMIPKNTSRDQYSLSKKPADTTAVKKPFEAQKKIVYIVKQDTLIVVDSLKVKSNKQKIQNR